jgi:predicted O-linked N-acetylglucosamine transferase (SPINDLY family)
MKGVTSIVSKLRKILDRLFVPQRSAGSHENLSADDKYIEEGRLAEKNGDLVRAIEFYRLAVQAKPDKSLCYLNLGVALLEKGDIEESRDVLAKVSEMDERNPYGYYNLGNLEYTERNYARAAELYRSALNYKNDFPEARVALANALEGMGREGEALEELVFISASFPDYEGACLNLAILANKLRRYEDSEDAANKLLDQNPMNFLALELLVHSLWGQGRCAEAIESIKRLRTHLGDLPALESRELFLLNYDEKITNQELFDRHREFGRKLEALIKPTQTEAVSLKEKGRLRIGYLSADFNWHPVALFLLPVLARHDKKGFDIYCYYTGDKEDDVTMAMKSMSDHWRDGPDMTDEDLFRAIRSDEIDILLDLAGHTSSSRLSLFALEPAPVQVSWMGYLNTTGLSRMHYRLCDERTDPSGYSDTFHTEKLVRLPHSQWCYRPFIVTEGRERAPFEDNGFITFGSFNHTLKVSQEICGLWGDVLTKVPKSRLLFLGLNSSRKISEILAEMTAIGIDADRLIFAARTDLVGYYNLMADADIALDTYPYGGGTTTFDALWMGVPVVTAKGSTPSSRSAASILEALGLVEWIAPTIDDYVRVAVERSMDVKRVVELRKSLRGLLQSSPLMDEEKFVHDLESAYRTMWHEYCDKKGPFQYIQ